MREVFLSGVFLYMCGIKKNQLRASRRSAYVLTSNHSIDNLLIITEHAIDRILQPTFCTFPHAFFMCKKSFSAFNDTTHAGGCAVGFWRVKDPSKEYFSSWVYLRVSFVLVQLRSEPFHPIWGGGATILELVHPKTRV